MDDAFCIGQCAEGVAALFEHWPQFGEVVNLAVEDDPDTLVFVRDRLIASVEINDGEATHGKSHARRAVKAVAIGTAMRDGRVHAFEQGFFNRMLIVVRHAADATHKAMIPCLPIPANVNIAGPRFPR